MAKNGISFFFFLRGITFCLSGVSIPYHEIDHKCLSVKTILSSHVIKKWVWPQDCGLQTSG